MRIRVKNTLKPTDADKPIPRQILIMVSNVIVLYPKEKFIIPINFKYSNYLNKTLQNTKFQNQHKLNINCDFLLFLKKIVRKTNKIQFHFSSRYRSI